MKEKDWFRIKKYPHIGLPFENKDRQFVSSYVKDKNKIISHAFYPLIHRELSVRKFRRKRSDDGSRSSKRFISYKNREVFYATHLDALIYSYYAELLNKHYEKFLKGKSVSESITAYRKIKVDDTLNSRNKNNIDFANDVFSYIESNRNKKLVAITFDITSFFDHLDHLILKKMWCKVLNNSHNLPDHHYAVFRNLTKFSYVEIDELFDEFKNEIIVRKDNGVVEKASVPNIHLLKEKNAIAFCKLEDFDKRIRKKNLIKNNKRVIDSSGKLTLRKKGIPQGSPISAVLANIYLIDFDSDVNDFVRDLGGIYQRYSDDMVVIVEEKHRDSVIDKFKNEISKYKLEIQPSKTQIFYFKKFNGVYGCREFNLDTNSLIENRTFDYLGFSFDGKNVYLKSSGLAKYYRKMKRSFQRGAFYAKHGKNNEPKLFKNRLYKRFTYIGSSRRTIYERDSNNFDKWIPTNKYDWGNFLTYAELAENIFGKGKIKHQVKNSWKIFHQLMEKKEIEIEKFHKNKK
ncbi:reverse transcriptase domain-containing protein [Croceibacter atlanticus]|uniref:reverse transcriptase domain-containing protein n=1 Tax=Croceibacter atlanticus TaxID=313588 RepID=UPI0024932288|nr:reverse transcriptase domain-containing protein [Croceibacter atlanticus]